MARMISKAPSEANALDRNEIAQLKHFEVLFSLHVHDLLRGNWNEWANGIENLKA